MTRALRTPAAPGPRTVPRPRRRGGLRRAEARAGAALVLPSVLLVVVLVVLPIVWSLLLAFKDLRLVQLATAPLLGDFTFASLADVLTSEQLRTAIGVTLAYSVIGTAGAIGIGLVGALALRRPFRGRGLIRALLLLPFVAPIVATTFAWKVLLNPQYGLVNAWGTRWLGWDQPVNFLSQRRLPVHLFGAEIDLPLALGTVILFEMWRTFPFAFLFLTARLQAMPKDLDEAALIDGATPSQLFRHVLLPQLLPIIAVLAVLRFIWTFNNFDDVYLLTQGRAGTGVVSIGVFDYLVGRGDIGAASAQALVLAVILAVLVGIYLRLMRGRGATE